MIKDSIKKWLGIWDLEYKMDKLVIKLDAVKMDQQMVRDNLATQLRINNELMHKVATSGINPAPEVPPQRSEYSSDALFNQAQDLWLKRKQDSDAIAESTIRRLKAEDWARRHTTGEV